MKFNKKAVVLSLILGLFLVMGCSSQVAEIQDTATNNSTTQQEQKNVGDGELTRDTLSTESNGDVLSMLESYVESQVLTQAEAEELAVFIKENKPATIGRGQQGEQADPNSNNPLVDAVEEGIITQEQAEQLQGMLKELASSVGIQNGENQRGKNQGLPQEERPQDTQGDTQASQGGNGLLVGMLNVSQANAIEAELLEKVGYTATVDGYPIVDTNQTAYYSDLATINEPSEGYAFYGQDATYSGNQTSYKDNGDGTVTDNVTGLMWQQDPGNKMTWEEAVENLETFNLGGYDDWRLPTIKELYSLVQFSGVTGRGTESSIPYLDTDYFVFYYGDESNGERYIDSQMATSTIYDYSTMGGNSTMFGYNFADGRIKGYPTTKKFYVYYVRGNTSYGQNMFVDNGDGTITDLATGLMWMMYDSAYYDAGDARDGTMDWEESLEWCEDLDIAGYDDWKLPDAKELQSIVDYTRAPDTTDSAAIDEMFYASEITNCFGEDDYGYYWTSTTHLEGRVLGGNAVYVAFGRGNGLMNGNESDVHGAGCQRSDLKTGDRDDYPTVNENAPQGDEQRVYNLVRAVRVIED